jgi:putative ABC transport system permease protein
LVGLSTLATSILVFLLSLRLRKREILTMKKIGGSRSRIFAILASEIVVVLLMGIVVAAILTGFVSFFGATLINELLLN